MLIARSNEGICVCHSIAEFPYVRFTKWNPRMVELTGYQMAEINRLGWYQTLYPDEELRARAMERMTKNRHHDGLRTSADVHLGIAQARQLPGLTSMLPAFSRFSNISRSRGSFRWAVASRPWHSPRANSAVVA